MRRRFTAFCCLLLILLLFFHIYFYIYIYFALLSFYTVVEHNAKLFQNEVDVCVEFRFAALAQ